MKMQLQMMLKHTGQVVAMKMLKRGRPSWEDLFEQIETTLQPFCRGWSVQTPPRTTIRPWVQEVALHCVYEKERPFKFS